VDNSNGYTTPMLLVLVNDRNKMAKIINSCHIYNNQNFKSNLLIQKYKIK
jgi:hypothetical protein